MRYTKRALLLFGAGLALALIVVAADIAWAGRLASAAMALGLAALPAAMLMDWRRAARGPGKPARARPAARRRRAAPPRRKPKPVASRRSP